MAKTKKKRIRYWVLRQDKLYFHYMSRIGAKCTKNLDEAATFRTKREAMKSPAYSFPSSWFTPEAIR